MAHTQSHNPNLTQNHRKTIVYKKFLKALFDRGIKLKDWCETYQIERSGLYRYFTEGLGRKRGGVQASRIKHLLISQNLPMPEHNGGKK
jgi:hypothetical protein